MTDLVKNQSQHRYIVIYIPEARLQMTGVQHEDRQTGSPIFSMFEDKIDLTTSLIPLVVTMQSKVKRD